MCSATVLGRCGSRLRRWLATRLPRWKISTVAADDLHGDLHFGFVAGFVGTGRDDGGAVMPGHIGVSPVDHRVVKARLGNTGLQIVADRLACRAIKIGEGANMRGDPIRKGLAPYCLGVGEARRAERGDKDLHRDDLAAETVD